MPLPLSFTEWTHSPEVQKITRESIKACGFDITIENRKNTIRSGQSKNGIKWSVKMPADYGYIKRTEGADGDAVDVYVGENLESPVAFIIDQIDATTGLFDEHKTMLGFDTIEDARDTYIDGFSDGKGGQRIGSISQMSLEDFRKWVFNSKDTTEPYDISEALDNTIKIFCDMDGVLVDFDSGLKAISGGLGWKQLEPKVGHDGIWKLINSGGSDWWADLKWEKDGKQLWNAIKEYPGTTILTAGSTTYTGNLAIKGKTIWCIKNLGRSVPVIIEDRGIDKKNYARPNHILIDDMEENIKAWRAAGGIGILHENTPKTLTELHGIIDGSHLTEDWKSLVVAGVIAATQLYGHEAPDLPYVSSVAPGTAITQTTNRKIEAQLPSHAELIVAATLIGEAGGEGEKGMHAVLNVIMNRTGSRSIFTAAKVCIQPHQFSMWNGKRDKADAVVKQAMKHPRWHSAMLLVKQAEDGTLTDITSGADFYFNPHLAMPKWSRSFSKTETIGRHNFYKHVGNVSKFF